MPHRFGRMKIFSSFDGVVQVNTSHRQKGSSGDEPMLALTSRNRALPQRLRELASATRHFNFDDNVYDDEEGEDDGGYSRHKSKVEWATARWVAAKRVW